MKVKTSELGGRALDWAVWATEKDRRTIQPRKGYTLNIPKFSSDWNKCGPLIGLYKVSVTECSESWIASIMSDYDREMYAGLEQGGSPSIAICRAVVSAKLGDEVEIPDELMEVK